jgi:hypothetical protein
MREGNSGMELSVPDVPTHNIALPYSYCTIQFAAKLHHLHPSKHGGEGTVSRQGYVVTFNYVQ